jgi:uncharacterized phage-associated protein
MNTLTSLDFSDIINLIAFNRHGVLLNKTQMQKLLFMCYGFYLASTNKLLFEDDTPKAWPFGPVFPRVNKRFVPGKICPISADKKIIIAKDQTAMKTILNVVDKYHNTSASALSQWSHQENGPWYQTIYGKDGKNTSIKWNQVIDNDIIKTYFAALK